MTSKRDVLARASRSYFQISVSKTAHTHYIYIIDTLACISLYFHSYSKLGKSVCVCDVWDVWVYLNRDRDTLAQSCSRPVGTGAGPMVTSF